MKKLKKIISIALIIFLIFGRVGVYAVVLASEEGEVVPETTSTEESTTNTTTSNTGDSTENNPEGNTENTETQTGDSTSSPPQEAATVVDNEAQVSNEVDSSAETGENAITEITPTPTPEITGAEGGETEETPTCNPEFETQCPEETQEVVEKTEETGEETGEEQSECNPELETQCPQETSEEGDSTSGETGEEVVTGNEEQGENSQEQTSQVETDDAVSVTQVENDVNSVEVGSNVVYQTLNIFVPGDINLSLDPLAIVDRVINGDKNNDPIITIALLDAQNYAYISNEIVSVANTGSNSIEGEGSALITTGDAYSIVSLLNKVNTTITDSTIHILTINIFGEVEGNILLPEYGTSNGECCSQSTTVSNSATVINEVDSEAVSGENSITTTGESKSSIETGNAQSAVSIINIINTTLINTIFHYLFINNLGTWLGDFLGWDGLAGQEGGESMLISSIEGGSGDECLGCTGDLSVTNEAYVENNISSLANSGGNRINGSGGYIRTGNAYSSVSIFNFINTTIRNSKGFFGSINIFGLFKGDIGGVSLFEKEEEEEKETMDEETSSSSEEEEGGDPGPRVKEAGGMLDIYQYNNINDHVFPGDTVTFFIDIKNPGTGRVYDTKLAITLFNEDGLDVGGAVFNLGDLKQKEGFKITTGLVLSKETLPGRYTAYAEIIGYVGPGDNLISDNSISFIPVVAKYSFPGNLSVVEEAEAIEPKKEVLGVYSSPEGMTKEEMFKFFVLGLTSLYVPSKSYQKRKEIARVIVKSSKQIGLFLTSFFA